MSGRARAQTVSLQSQSYNVERAVARTSSEQPYSISRQDCLDDDPSKPDYDRNAAPDGRTWARFTIYITGKVPQNSRLEIWSSQGAVCTDTNERKLYGRCRQVYSNPNAATTQVSAVAHVYPRVIVGGTNVTNLDTSDPANYPGPEVCDQSIEQAYTFYIILFNGDNILSSTSWTKTRVDLVGPSPPPSVSADPGDAHVFVKWNIPSGQQSLDTQGFRLYCAPADPDAPAAAMGGGSGIGSCGSVLVPGELPPGGNEYECGTINGRAANRGTASGLENGTYYAVAVAARDQINNSGTLSDAVCLTPEEVTTFFESYKASGGRGGGGYCGLSSRPPNSWLFFLCWVALGGYLRRRATMRQTSAAIRQTGATIRRTGI